jgi:hypothetical protein
MHRASVRMISLVIFGNLRRFIASPANTSSPLHFNFTLSSNAAPLDCAGGCHIASANSVIILLESKLSDIAIFFCSAAR